MKRKIEELIIMEVFNGLIQEEGKRQEISWTFGVSYFLIFITNLNLNLCLIHAWVYNSGISVKLPNGTCIIVLYDRQVFIQLEAVGTP